MEAFGLVTSIGFILWALCLSWILYESIAMSHPKLPSLLRPRKQPKTDNDPAIHRYTPALNPLFGISASGWATGATAYVLCEEIPIAKNNPIDRIIRNLDRWHRHERRAK